MKPNVRYTIATVGIIAAILSIVYGSYLPIARSRRYIEAIRALPDVRSFTEFKRLYDRALAFSAPIGDEELAKFAEHDVLGIIQNPNHPEEVARNLVRYMEGFMVETNLRHLLALGQMYDTLWRNYQKEEYYESARQYYERARDIGPKIPPVLFTLLKLYLDHGDIEKAGEVGRTILEYWPNALK